jgi:Uncharacterized protein conserved in bacteria
MIKTNNIKYSSKIGFDNAKYVKMQSAKINDRIKQFDGKLYMEFGGKIFDDLHASRVLPGFNPGSKIEMLKELKDDLEIIFCISARDIENRRERNDHGISYDVELLRLIDSLKILGIETVAVVITLYEKQPEATKFKKQLARKGYKVYFHTYTEGYPTDIDTIVSEKGYGAQPYIETTKPLVVVSAPGPNSGKLATVLAQLYHENKRGVKAGYAKFETFPVWSLPLKHPVNMAYEAATADIGDINMIDSFHLEAYGKTAVNYNRDLEIFPVLKNILHRITGEDLYRSPTDMGVNMIGSCISDDEVVRDASCDEIIRRYLAHLCDYKNGVCDIDVPNRIKLLMDELEIDVSDREVVEAAIKAKKQKESEIVAIQLANGEIVTGKNTNIMTAPATMVINAIKALSGIDDAIHLISPINLDPILKIQREVYGKTRLNLQDVLIALAMGETTNPTVGLALSNLSKLRGLEAHSTVMLSKIEAKSLKKLGINISCTDEFDYSL